MVDWLNKKFFAFDDLFFQYAHRLQQKAGGFFNTFCKVVSFFGKSGWAFIAIAFVFLLFKGKRKAGLAMGFALVMGAIVTNILLKNIVDRPRPYTRSLTFANFWVAAGKNVEDSSSFPSGHTTAAFAAGVAFFLSVSKKYGWTGLVFAVLMGFSRVYLIVHYPSDVLAGCIIGTAAGIGGHALSKLVYDKAKGKFATFINEWSILDHIVPQNRLRRKQAETATDTAPQNTAPQDDVLRNDVPDAEQSTPPNPAEPQEQTQEKQE